MVFQTVPQAESLVSRLLQASTSSPLSLVATLLASLLVILAIMDKIISPTVDPREPPVLKGSLPVLGHSISIKTKYPFVYQRLAHFPICTIPLLNKKTYVLNTPAVVQSAMRNKILTTDARIESIGHALGLSPDQVNNILQRNGIEELSKITTAALSGDNLYRLNLVALSHIAGRLNAGGPSPVRLDNFFLWTQNLVGTATTVALYGEKNPFEDPHLVECIWKYEEGVGKLQYGWLSQIFVGDSLQARKKIVMALAKYYMSKSDQADGTSVSALIRMRGAFWRSCGVPESTIAEMDMLPVSATVNTAPSMFWLLANTFGEPKYLERLRKELESVAAVYEIEDNGVGKRVGTINVQTLLKSCPYLSACYRETLRYVSCVTGTREVVGRDTTLTDHESGREYLLKQGVTVEWSATVLHNQEVWGESADRFIPDRWIQNWVEQDKSRKESFVPFGGGKHLCPGRNFAFAELLGSLACLALGFDIEGVKVPGHSMKYSHAGVVHPNYGKTSAAATLIRRTGFENVEWRFK